MRNKKGALRLGILLLSLVFIGIGIWQEEYLEVMEKAVSICLE